MSEVGQPPDPELTTHPRRQTTPIVGQCTLNWPIVRGRAAGVDDDTRRRGRIRATARFITRKID